MLVSSLLWDQADCATGTSSAGASAIAAEANMPYSTDDARIA